MLEFECFPESKIDVDCLLSVVPMQLLTTHPLNTKKDITLLDKPDTFEPVTQLHIRNYPDISTESFL